MADFAFDGCTGWPDRWFGLSIRACCLDHDLDYWVQDLNKLASDWALAACVYETLGGLPGLLVAGAMMLGVSTAGWIFWRRGKRGERLGG